MPPPPPVRRLIVNADDFGRSRSINAAVVRAHRDGILTAASLMVNEPACDEAVAMAREHPGLGVGLHLTLLCGRTALAANRIPGLVAANTAPPRFRDDPVGVGLRYFFQRNLRPQLEAEISAQFERFRATGLRLDHVNGHLNLHLHPTVFGILMARARDWGVTRLRLTCDPFWLNARLASGEWLYRISHAVIFRLLSARARRVLRRLGLRSPDRVFGLLQNARVDEDFVTGLLPRLPGGDSELYSHPSLDESRPEFDALVSPRVKALVAQEGIQLIRYQDL
ncbi:MAG: hopanoid biosynthesis-associated protein HpnK [Verrucomicrobia bacterium]|nr:hopanoid biosynthesis-associated protein HpnK [Verrucomicrobiota bacterium]